MHKAVPGVYFSALRNMDDAGGKVLRVRVLPALSGKNFRHLFRRAVRASIGDANNFATPSAPAEFGKKRLLEQRIKHPANALFFVPGDNADGNQRRHGC